VMALSDPRLGPKRGAKRDGKPALSSLIRLCQ
jgi:hypothetical protein